MDNIAALVNEELVHQRDEVGEKVPPGSEEANWGIDGNLFHPL